uniref:Uncharacterized protein n=1 Tax=Triticum urartu TaxID=4572 RepID=A0A8R7TGE5_TRIUA
MFHALRPRLRIQHSFLYLAREVVMKPFLVSPSPDLRRRLPSLDLRSALPLRHNKGRRWDWRASGCGVRVACGGRGPVARRRGDTPVGYQQRQRLSACFFS